MSNQDAEMKRRFEQRIKDEADAKRNELRELYAGLAMQGILSNPSIDILEPHEVAHSAILYAGALIEELERTK